MKVHKDKSHGTQFVEEICAGGFMLRALDGLLAEHGRNFETD